MSGRVQAMGRMVGIGPLVAAIGLLAVVGSAASQPASTGDRPRATEKSKTAPKSAAVLPGANPEKPINIQAQKLDYFDKEQKLIYTGNVIAVQGDSTLKSSVLTIFLTPKKSGEAKPAQSSTSQVQHMIAEGPVTLLQRDQVGTGDHGVYDKPTDTVTLTGNVTLTQGPNVTKGDKLVYNVKSGRAVVTNDAAHGPVTSMFIPDDSTASNSEAKADPAPAPAPRRTKKKRSGG